MGDTSNKNSKTGSHQAHLRESLSALMDGEANELETRRVLDRLDSDEALRATAVSYQRIGAAIRQEQTMFADIDLSASIRDAIKDEPIPESPDSCLPEDQGRAVTGESKTSATGKPNSKGQGWFVGLGRMAVAASVAAATVLGVHYWQLSGPGGNAGLGELAAVSEPVLDASGQSSSLPSTDLFGVRELQAGFGAEQHSATSEQTSQQDAQDRLRAYIQEHSERASIHVDTIVPMVRAFSHDSSDH